MRTTYSYEVAGKHYESESHKLKPRAPASKITVYINASSPEGATIEPYKRQADDPLQWFIRMGPAIYMPIGLALLAFWYMWVATSRPAAAGLRHRVEPGQGLWVRLSWRNNRLISLIIPGSVWIFAIIIDLFSMFLFCKEAYGNLAYFGVLGMLGCWHLIAKRHCNADITADLQAGTLQVPVITAETAANDCYPTQYRTVLLSEVESFGLMEYREKGTTDLTLWQLRLRMNSGEEIPIIFYSGYIAASLIDVFGIQVLAHWLNAQLGLPQPKYLALPEESEEAGDRAESAPVHLADWNSEAPKA